MHDKGDDDYLRVEGYCDHGNYRPDKVYPGEGHGKSSVPLVDKIGENNRHEDPRCIKKQIYISPKTVRRHPEGCDIKIEECISKINNCSLMIFFDVSHIIPHHVFKPAFIKIT